MTDPHAQDNMTDADQQRNPQTEPEELPSLLKQFRDEMRAQMNLFQNAVKIEFDKQSSQAKSDKAALEASLHEKMAQAQRLAESASTQAAQAMHASQEKLVREMASPRPEENKEQPPHLALGDLPALAETPRTQCSDTDTIRNMGYAVPVKHLRTSLFDGTREYLAVEGWINEVKEDLHIAQIGLPIPFTDGQKMAMAAQRMTGAARSWWLITRASGHAPQTLQGFFQAIRDEYIPADHAEKAREKLYSIEQGSHSVATYVDEFRNTALQCVDMDGQEELARFKAGLRNDIYFHVHMQEPKTTSQAMRIALKIDAAKIAARRQQHGGASGSSSGQKQKNRPPPPAPVYRQASITTPGQKAASPQPNQAHARAPAGDPMEIGNTEVCQPPPGVAKLTDDERAMLRAKGGCFRCRRDNCGAWRQRNAQRRQARANDIEIQNQGGPAAEEHEHLEETEN